MPGSPVRHCLLEFAQIHVHWVADAISSSTTPFSFCLLASPALGSFPVTWLFTEGGQSIGVSASSPVLPMNIQGWFPLRLTGFISFQSKGLSRLFSSTTIKKYQFFCAQSSSPTSTHDYWETIALTIWTFVSKVMSLLFNTLSKFVIASLPRSKHLLISWLQSLSTVILELKKTKSVTASPFPPYICHEAIRLASMIFAFSMLSFKPASPPPPNPYTEILIPRTSEWDFIWRWGL